MSERKNGKQPESPIRVIVTDIDGTLLNSRMELSPRNEAALRQVIERGIHVVLATGKTRHAGEWIIKKLNLKSPGIFLQGLVTYDADGQIMHQQTLDPAVARSVITFADERGFLIVAYSGKRILVKGVDPRLEGAITAYHDSPPEAVGALHNLIDHTPLHKLMMIGDARSITALRWQLEMLAGGQIRLMQAGIPTMVEVLPPGGSKGTALKQLMKDLNVKPEAVMAIGDAENDIEMLQIAGIGVAMGQAHQPVKDAADFVTASNDEDGVAVAIEKFVLKAGVEPVQAAPETTQG